MEYTETLSPFPQNSKMHSILKSLLPEISLQKIFPYELYSYCQIMSFGKQC